MPEDLGVIDAPVGNRKDHDGTCTHLLCDPRLFHRCGGGNLCDPDDRWKSSVDSLASFCCHQCPLVVGEVSRFTGTAERGNGMYLRLQQSIDEVSEHRNIDGLIGERSDEVTDDSA